MFICTRRKDNDFYILDTLDGVTEIHSYDTIIELYRRHSDFWIENILCIDNMLRMTLLYFEDKDVVYKGTYFKIVYKVGVYYISSYKVGVYYILGSKVSRINGVMSSFEKDVANFIILNQYALGETTRSDFRVNNLMILDVCELRMKSTYSLFIKTRESTIEFYMMQHANNILEIGGTYALRNEGKR